MNVGRHSVETTKFPKKKKTRQTRVVKSTTTVTIRLRRAQYIIIYILFFPRSRLIRNRRYLGRAPSADLHTRE